MLLSTTSHNHNENEKHEPHPAATASVFLYNVSLAHTFDYLAVSCWLATPIN